MSRGLGQRLKDGGGWKLLCIILSALARHFPFNSGVIAFLVLRTAAPANFLLPVIDAGDVMLVALAG